MRFTNHNNKVFTAKAHVEVYERVHSIPVRIDGREGSYRVDVAKPLMPMWEAIDGGNGFITVAAAKLFVARWLIEAHQQNTLSPRV